MLWCNYNDERNVSQSKYIFSFSVRFWAWVISVGWNSKGNNTLPHCKRVVNDYVIQEILLVYISRESIVFSYWKSNLLCFDFINILFLMLLFLNNSNNLLMVQTLFWRLVSYDIYFSFCVWDSLLIRITSCKFKRHILIKNKVSK